MTPESQALTVEKGSEQSPANLVSSHPADWLSLLHGAHGWNPRIPLPSAASRRPSKEKGTGRTQRQAQDTRYHMQKHVCSCVCFPGGQGDAPREGRHVSCLIKILEQKALCQGSLVAHLLGKLFS